MRELIKLKTIINKRNGQINTSIPKKKLPKNILDAIRKQPGSIKNLFVDIRGADFDD